MGHLSKDVNYSNYTHTCACLHTCTHMQTLTCTHAVSWGEYCLPLAPLLDKGQEELVVDQERPSVRYCMAWHKVRKGYPVIFVVRRADLLSKPASVTYQQWKENTNFGPVSKVTSVISK